MSWEVLQGDCRELIKTLDVPVDVIATDPPFGMAFQSNYRLLKHRAIAGDADEGLLKWACELPAAHSKYIFCRWNNLASIPEPKSLITWVKNVHSMGDLEHEHARQTEVCAFYPGEGHAWNGKRPTDVVFHDRSGNNLHPTEKPLSLMLEIVGWTPPGCTILDPFCGSGTTGVACAITGRNFIGLELDGKYCEIARRRISEAVPLWAPEPVKVERPPELFA